MLKRIVLISMVAFVPVMLFAQRTVTASGTFTYNLPTSITPDHAKLTALDKAQVEIIEKEFGRVVGVNNYTQVVNEGEDSSVTFLSLGESEVKGEWIETIGTPKVDYRIADNQQVITVTITGRIREIVSSKVEFEAKILRNGLADKYEDTDFREGDDFYISFSSPVDGNVIVLLYDLSDVYRLLPLKLSKEAAFPVTANKKYVFFANGVSYYDEVENRNPHSIHSTYALTCSSDGELNRVFIVFSPNPFTKASDVVYDNDLTPAYIDYESFQKWLSRCRKRDKDMVVWKQDIIIRK